MSSYFGNVAVLLPEDMTRHEIKERLLLVGQMLDNEFMELPAWEEETLLAPDQVVGVLPRHSQWLTCCDPVSDEGFDGEVAVELAEIYSRAFGTPALSFALEDSRVLVLGCSIPHRRFSQWYARGKALQLAEYGIGRDACQFPKEAGMLLPTQYIFTFHRVWNEEGYPDEEERLHDIAQLFRFCVLGNMEDLMPPEGAQVFCVPFGGEE